MNAKVYSKELVKHTLAKNKHRTLNGGQKKIVFGGPRVKKARVDSKELVEHTLARNKHRTLNGGQKKMVFGGLPEGDSRSYHQEKCTDNEYHSYKGRGKDQKRKGKDSSRNVDSLQ